MCKHNALDIIVTLPFYASTLTYNMSRIKICRWGDGYGSSSLKSILHLLQAPVKRQMRSFYRKEGLVMSIVSRLRHTFLTSYAPSSRDGHELFPQCTSSLLLFEELAQNLFRLGVLSPFPSSSSSSSPLKEEEEPY